MRRSILFLFIFLCAGNLFAGKFVYRDGAVIRDSTGKTIHLNGVNLGGWLLWEGWIWGGGFTRQATVQKNMESLVGRAEADSFRYKMYTGFIGEADIRSISEMGLNVVRIPVNNRIFTEPVNGKICGWEILDNLLSWCRRYHVYAVIDMHAAPGGQSPYFIADPDKPNLWKDPAARTKTVALWKQIAQRYANDPVVAGYDLLNEPIPAPKDSLVKMYGRIIQAIRTVDQQHMMILEGANFAKDFSMFKSLPENNMLFSFHIYTWLGGEPADKIKDYVALSKKFNVPVWCGEWGENTYEVLEKTLKVFSDTANGFSGWCFWTWKKVLNSYPALNAINVTASWKDLIKWCGNGSVKNSPGHDAALVAMKEFENDVLFTNTKRDERLAALLKKYSGE